MTRGGKTITQLDELTSVAGADYVVVEDTSTGTTKKALASNLADYVGQNLTGVTIANVAGLQGALDAKQTIDGELTALAGVTSSANKLFYFTGSATGALASFTSFGRTLVASADAATAQTALGFSSFASSFIDDTDAKTFRATTGTRPILQIKVIDDATSLTTGDNKLIFCIDSSLNGLDLVAAHAAVTTVSSSGTPTVQIRNKTNANVDMLSTRITIDVSEFTSYTAAVPPVINTSNDNVATGDLIAIDVDVAGTSTGGLIVILTFG